MIVRLMGEGQYRIDQALAERLNEIDNGDLAGSAEVNPRLSLSPLGKEHGQLNPVQGTRHIDLLVDIRRRAPGPFNLVVARRTVCNPTIADDPRIGIYHTQ